MRHYAGWFCFVLLLGGMIGFSAGKWNVEAQAVDNKTSRYLAGTIAYAPSSDAFVLFDSQTNRLCAYTLTGGKQFQLLAVREVSWDLKAVTYGKQEPTVQEMRDAFEKSEKEKKEEKKEEKK